MNDLSQAKSIVVRFPPETLSISPEQVARYAGGSSYKMNTSMREIVSTVIEHSSHLLAPAMVWAMRPVASLSSEGGLLLRDGISLRLPPHERDQHTKYLSAVICTIGPALEETCHQLTKQGNLLHAILLDGAGVALIEAVGERAYEFVSQQARKQGLFSSCRFAPGYGGMPMTEQSLLFSLVDGATIGVSLNNSMVMTPNKSISFFVRLTSEKTSSTAILKCQSCQAIDCKFRIQQKS